MNPTDSVIYPEDIEKMREKLLEKVRQRDDNAWIVVDKVRGIIGERYIFNIHHSKGIEKYVVEENPFTGLGWVYSGNQ